MMLKDNKKARIEDNEGSYTLKKCVGEAFNSQEMLYQLAYDRAARKMISDSPVNKELKKNNEDI